MVEVMSVVVNVMSLIRVMSPPTALRNQSVRTVVRLCTFEVFALGVSLVSCMYVVNKQFELLEFVFDYVYVDLQYDDISPILLLSLLISQSLVCL